MTRQEKIKLFSKLTLHKIPPLETGKVSLATHLH